MTGAERVVAYVTREHPTTALDELVILEDLGGAPVEIVRELGVADGTRYVQAKVVGALPADWEGRWETLRVSGHPEPFVDLLVRQRVVIYATRERERKTELLTIETLEYPEEGLQVPAGRIDHGETVEAGLHRELEEETGLTSVRIVRELPDFVCTYRTYSRNRAFHVVVETETPDEWEHRVGGKGTDAGLTYHCRWVPLSLDLPLWNALDPMLAKLGV